MAPRTLIVGDVHGCYEELLDLLAHAGATADDELVSVGDLVDRGPDSGRVVELFRSRANSLALCGNHERKHVRGVLTYGQEIVSLQLGEGYADAVRWMGTLPYYLERPEVRVVHAALVPGKSLAETPQDILCGTTTGEARLQQLLNGRWWHELYDEEVPVVFGHHVTGDEPLVVRDRVFGIDTGCCHGGRLTALSVPDFKLWSVPSRGDHWAAEQRRWQVPVLRARPWGSMSFEQLRAKAKELSQRHPDAEPYLAGVTAWADAVRARIPSLHARARAILAELEAGPEGLEAVERHPAAATLLALHKGRLSPEHLGCAGPPQVFALAQRLGAELEVPSSPPAG